MSSPDTPIRVLLVDDHDILRHGLKLLFKTQPDMEVIGEARNDKEALTLTGQLHPDVIVLDISMAEMDGLEVCQRIRASYPETQVLMLTMHESEEYFLRSLQMGASGYLVKKAAPSDLSNAVRAIKNGGVYLYPGLAKALVKAYLAPSPQRERTTSPSHTTLSSNRPLDVLTPRELEVLKLVAEGRTNQEIANHLVLSIKTVQAHRANVMVKLGLHDVTHLVRFAIHYGLIPPEP